MTRWIVWASEEETVGSAEGAERSGGDDNGIVWFLYTGQPIDDIPRDVTHARIDPSVKYIARGGIRKLLPIGGGGRRAL